MAGMLSSSHAPPAGACDDGLIRKGEPCLAAQCPADSVLVSSNKDHKDHKHTLLPRRDLSSATDTFLLGLFAIMAVLTLLVAALTYALTTHARVAQPLSEQLLGHKAAASSVTGTSFLDHDQPISGFAGQTFLKDNIPFIDIPDSLIQDVYYYRWTLIQRHLRYTVPGTGYMLNEFLQGVGYAKAFGSIDAAAGHQIDESRWLRDTQFGDDYIQLYTRGPGDSLQYTQWILDAMNRRAALTGDSKFLSTQVEDMIRVWDLWDRSFDSDAGLYFYQPVWDAQEYSLPGLVAAHGIGKVGEDLPKDGPDTFRPSHKQVSLSRPHRMSLAITNIELYSAYMVANARAIANAAQLSNDGFNEAKYSDLANKLENAMYNRMWDPDRGFFVSQAQRLFLLKHSTDELLLISACH